MAKTNSNLIAASVFAVICLGLAIGIPFIAVDSSKQIETYTVKETVPNRVE
jgi:hypothetical protein